MKFFIECPSRILIISVNKTQVEIFQCINLNYTTYFAIIPLKTYFVFIFLSQRLAQLKKERFRLSQGKLFHLSFLFSVQT